MEVEVVSAGLDAVRGERPPPEVQEVMRDYGIDVSGHRAKVLEDAEAERADLILTMALHNSQRLLTRRQELVDRVFTLKEFVLQGEKKSGLLAGSPPEERARALKGWIRGMEGWRPGLESDLNTRLRLFMLYYFYVYDHTFTIDDPLGQSMDFLRRTAEEIRDLVVRMAEPGLLGLVGGESVSRSRGGPERGDESEGGGNG